MARSVYAAGDDAPFHLGSPTLRHRLTGEVDNGVGTVETLGRRLRFARTPLGELNRRGKICWTLARQGVDRVACVQQR
jgi:hypothetical protein